jgi:hypothetical protein
VGPRAVFLNVIVKEMLRNYALVRGGVVYYYVTRCCSSVRKALVIVILTGGVRNFSPDEHFVKIHIHEVGRVRSWDVHK